MPPSTANDQAISLDQLRQWIKSGRVLSHLARHSQGRILVQRLESAGRPLPLAMLVRLLCRGDIYFEDATGRRRTISLSQLVRWTRQFATEPFRVPSFLGRVEREVKALASDRRVGNAVLNLSRPPVYLRTDLSFGVRAGGLVGHIAGVVNELSALGAPPIFITTDDVSTIGPEVETHYVTPSEAFWSFQELPTFLLNDALQSVSSHALAGREIAFVYQRYSLNNYAGLRIARTHGVPFVLEYNGSEIWMSRHWGRPLKYEALSEQIERLNLRRADLVVVVSRAMEKELVARGIDRARILVNFNGVDPARYSPDIDGRPVRERYGLAGKTVVGFIGTFGPWHGTEVFARAFVKLMAGNPALRSSTRLLMIGDGAGLPEVRRIVTEGGADDAVTFAGLVPQEEGPAYLAACDVLVSPHVPNPDGTAFFGSPTKLFEYMAMGKGIVASNLDQIGEVLQHDRDAWLVPPADVESLADGIRRLVVDSRLRDRLGAAARRAVLEMFTWRQHTRRTIDRLQAIFSADARVRLPAAGA